MTVMTHPKTFGKSAVLPQGNSQRDEELSNYVFGKLPPQAPALEEAVLGAIMLDKDAMATVLDILQPESFYSEAHQLIYQAMIDLFNFSQPIDLLTVMERLKKSGTLNIVGGPAYLPSLTNKVASAANIEFHARIIAQKFIQRELIRLGTRMVREAFEDTVDCFDALYNAETGLYEMRTGQSSSYKPISQIVGKLLNIGDKERVAKETVLTGYRELDQVVRLVPGKLQIIAARPGMGKSSLKAGIAENVASANKPVSIFTLEMIDEEFAARVVSIKSGVNINDMVNGSASPEDVGRWQDAIEYVAELPIYVDDTAAISITELRAKARRMKIQHDIQLIIIDYLQLMKDDGKGKGGRNFNREQEVTAIVQALKALAKELKIPIIALAQLSRDVEKRGGSKRPQLSDLRESGAIEQEADIVSFIYRPEYYNITEDPEGESLKGVAEIIVAKNRGGRLKDIRLRWEEQYTRFSNFDDFDIDEPIATALADTKVVTESVLITRSSRMNENEDIPF